MLLVCPLVFMEDNVNKMLLEWPLVSMEDNEGRMEDNGSENVTASAHKGAVEPSRTLVCGSDVHAERNSGVEGGARHGSDGVAPGDDHETDGESVVPLDENRRS